MKQADIFYRAFINYRKQTADDSKCKKLRSAISTASADNDKLEVISSKCIIKEDWVNRIYEGLPFIEKVIREERQFITQQGEVVPIEKAKHISKSSVEHLARHSDMITHEPKDAEADIIPDELYIVEKLSDYAVYENRFIYMLLCYLRDFIDIRYSKIIEEYDTYRAAMRVDKTVKLGKRVINCKIDFSEESKGDPFGFFDGHTDALLKKIEEERHIIAAFLLTPLMKIVAKSPMIKPPITRTNALKMNNNLKNALALYDYIAAYSGDGYKIEYTKKTYGPFSETMGDEFAEIISLNSFLTYEYGKELKNNLRESYEAEEERRRVEAEERHILLLKELKKRLEEGGGSMEEYILELESRNVELEEDRTKLAEAKEYISTLEGNILDYRRRQNEYLGEIDELRGDNAAKDEHIRKREEEFITEKTAIHVAHHTEKQELTEAYENKLEEQRVASEDEKRQMSEQHENELAGVKESYDAIITGERSRFETELAESKNKYEKLNAEKEAIYEEKTVLKAELRAQKQLSGTALEDGEFVEKERFAELDEEYAALKKLRASEWAKAKKSIRKRILWSEEEGLAQENEAQSEKSDENTDSVHSETSENTEKADKNIKIVISDIVNNKVRPFFKNVAEKTAELFTKMKDKICEITKRKR